jgi:TRAP-type C4-dicarboxylate transport system permease small subunit
MFDRYRRAMDAIHAACLWIAGICLFVITLIIPWGVYTRYVLGSGSQWPEPVAVKLMILFTFCAGSVCYRENLHIAVTALPSMTRGVARRLLGLTVEALMLAANAFLLVKGGELVAATWFQVLAAMPDVPVGLTYVPIALGGLVMGLFVIERIWGGTFFEPVGGSGGAIVTEAN